MNAWKKLGAGLMAAGMLWAQQPFEDPVMKVRVQRASLAGEDLPPVPRGILEPPPLSPPVTHVKDMPGYRASRKARRVKQRPVKKGKAKPAAVPVRKKLPKKP